MYHPYFRQAYEMGRQCALQESGLVKSAVEIPEALLKTLGGGAVGAAGGALASPIAENMSPGEGAIIGSSMGAGMGLGHHFAPEAIGSLGGMLLGGVGGSELARLALGKSREDLNFAQPSWTERLRKSLGIP